MDEDYEVLGEQIVNDLMGAGAGLDSGFLVSAASELAARGVNTYQEKQAADKVKADAQKAISADNVWASAEANADIASQGKDAQKITTTRALADAAARDADVAASGLTPDGVTMRCAAANASAKLAAENSSAATKDVAKAALMRAWQKIAAKCSSSASGSGALSAFGGGGAGGGSSFLTKMHAGIPTYGWILGGGVVLTGGILLIKSLRKKRR